MNPISPPSRLIPLVAAQRRVGVPYDTFITAHRAGRLALNKDEEDRLLIDVVDLVHYMISEAPMKYRWKPKRLPISEIRLRPELQPRTGRTGIVAKLEEHLRSGGTLEPIWLMRDGEELILVDGHQRLEAARRTERQMVRAYVIELPFDYAGAISRIGNLRHGINLSQRDQSAAVLKHVQEHPNVSAQLGAGTLSQAKLAQLLGVSVATVSRALRSELSPAEKEVVAPGPIFTGLRDLLAQVGSLRLPAEEIAVATVILRAAAETLYTNLTTAQVKQAKAAAAGGIGMVAAKTSKALLKLLDRRGGDRRRRQPKNE